MLKRKASEEGRGTTSEENDSLFARRGRKGNLQVLFTCFVLSVTFWIIHQLGQEHDVVFLHPLTFSAEPGEKIHIDPLPSRVVLHVQGKGWDLLRHRFNIKPINYPILHPHERTIIERRLKRIVEEKFPHLSVKSTFPKHEKKNRH